MIQSGDEVVGPAGPTTATRMDKFTRQVLEATGMFGMIGKADRGPAAVEAIKDNKATYLMAVGGAAYLVSKAIREAEVVAFADLRYGSNLQICCKRHACICSC